MVAGSNPARHAILLNNNMSIPRTYYFIEQVVTNANQRIAYSLPDAIDDPDLLKELIKIIESDPKIKLAVLGDASHPEYAEMLSSDIWKLLDQYPISATLKEKYPGIEKYRISSALTGGIHLQVDPGDKLEDTPFYKYDNWANKESKDSMPSFKKYINDVAKYNPRQISGASTKTILK